ncbi:MAG: hypothetical protein AAGG09_22225 [Pseudomonadota bacterium]
MGAAHTAAAMTALFLGWAPPAAALALEGCVRVVKGWNGWEIRHRDLGHGRVAFAESWSAEGTYLDLIVTECDSGDTVRTRVREEMVKDRPAFNRTARGVEIVDRHARRSPALFSIDALAADLADVGEDTDVRRVPAEFCACAALYPELRGEKTAFEGV